MSGAIGLHVSADPRITKQWLLSQWINHANPLDPAPAGGTEDGSLFGMLLQDMLSTAQEPQAVPPALPSVVPAAIPQPSSWFTPDGAFAPDEGTSGSHDELIHAAAARYGLDPALIKGVIRTESGFRADAVSHAGAKGLMQLMDATARGLGVTDSFDPGQNIDGGARFLSYLLRKYDGQVSAALAAYNAGPGRVDRLGLTSDALIKERIHELPEETQRYIGKVLSAAQHYGLQA